MDKKEKIEILRTKALSFVTSSWQKPELSMKYPVNDLESIVNRIIPILTINKAQKAFMIRLAGQSGSGKSTQLLPAAVEAFKAMDIDPITINVRYFSTFHPHYEKIKLEYGEENIRENTNGFALLLLFLTLEKLIKLGYPILFEVTLLDADFELYFSELAKTKEYSIDYHIIAVSKQISDSWIENRKKFSSTEKKRKVAKTSSDYFFKALPIAIESLKNTNNNCFIWSGYNKNPVFIGKIADNNALQTLKDYQNKEFTLQSTEKLLNSKTKWFSNYYSSKAVL